MDKQRILREAQKIASHFSFWMVSGNIAHLYGYVYEASEKKYELEIRFGNNFPNNPPVLIFHDNIKDLLGIIQLNNLKNWNPTLSVVEIIKELKEKIQDALGLSQKEQDLVRLADISKEEDRIQSETNQKSVDDTISQEIDEYLTPDLNAYPPDLEINEHISSSNSDYDFFYDQQSKENSSESTTYPPSELSKDELESKPKESVFEEFEETSIELNTELGLIQQEYTYDQIGGKAAKINVYITITLTKTFLIQLDFTNYPKRPVISVPEEVMRLLGDPYENLESLNKWNPKNPAHIVDILHELEKKLYLVKEIENQLKRIQGEYQCVVVGGSATQLKVHLLTYGFKEYMLDIDLSTHPHPPKIQFSPELNEILGITLSELEFHKNWKERESEPLEIIREISWLVDKKSRIHFEIDLLRENYQSINYDPLTETLTMEMKGKMKTEDMMFKFQIQLPREYPMKMPMVKVINEFELESHEKIKKDLHTSFDDFFSEWTPFSYLIDLFNLISKKIFEVSIVTCVICHKIECPTCGIRIAGSDKATCHVECPHCEKHYHLHCWQQTIRSFGKCGFCLR